MNLKFESMKNLFKSCKRPIVALGLAIALTSCTKDALDNESVAVTESEVTTDEIQDESFITKYFMGSEVQVRLEADGTYSLAGSDTRVFEDQLSDSASAYEPNPVPGASQTDLAIAGGVNKWPNNTIVYVVRDLSSQVRSELQKSFNEWSSKTNIRFKERTNESNYVTISSSGANSNSGVATLGVYGSRGYIRLGLQATAVVIIHEIGHTLGYIHEQNRSDRDNYLRINFENIQDNAKDQFYKSSSATSLTGQLDLNSIMMYGSYTFSKNGRPTITDLNGNTLPRRQAQLSSGDISGTNAAYPGGNDGGGGEEEEDVCSTTKEWSPNTRYYVGDLVIYQGRLYQRDYTRWNYIKRCS